LVEFLATPNPFANRRMIVRWASDTCLRENAFPSGSVAAPNAPGANAKSGFAVLGNPSASDYWLSDCNAMTENLLLAAEGLDLGAVWVAIYPRAPWRE
jgi:nitroreductase